jgi:hypothetical protein
MRDWNARVEGFFKIITYALVLSLIIVSFWASNWKLTMEADVVILFLIAYTLLLILPFSKFKLGPSGFEGELQRLAGERETTHVSAETAREVNEEVANISQAVVDDDSVLMRLSIEIETTLRSIAELSGMTNTRVMMGQLIRVLTQQQILTDRWLLNALRFFQTHRNELIHEGRTDDIREAIDVGRRVLEQLREIQQNLQRPSRQ